MHIDSRLKQLANNSLLNIAQLSAEQVIALVQYAAFLKKNPHKTTRPLQGKSLLLLFESPSTRTRLAFQTAMFEGGGCAINGSPSELHIGTKESLPDSVRAISQFCAAIAYRGTEHTVLEQINTYATIPVINALTNLYHPTQALADMLTIYEIFKTFSGIKVVYIGDSNNNVARSLAFASCKVGFSITFVSPKKYQLDTRTLRFCEAIAAHHKNLPQITDNVQDALSGAHVIYTDVWYSMGDEAEKKERIRALSPYQIDAQVMQKADSHAIFMHCLPAYRGQEVTDAVIDGKQSRVWQQANNRKHTIKALLHTILGQ